MADSARGETSLLYLIWGGATVIAFALMATAFATRTGIGVTRLEPVVAAEGKDLTMVENGDGGVLVTDIAQPARTWIVRPANGDGFVQVVVQGLMRTRGLAGVEPHQPVRLIRQSDGRLWLQDPSTQQQLSLDAFGPVSARAFLKFLDDGKAVQ